MVVVRDDFTMKDEWHFDNVKGKYSSQIIQLEKKCISCCSMECNKDSNILT